MKRALKQLAAMIIAALFAINALTCSALETLTAGIEASNADVGDVFEVKITIGTNEGISNGSFNVIYDNGKLELVSASSDTEMMKGVNYALNDKYAENAVRISFASSVIFGRDGGELMVLTFRAKAPGKAIFRVENLKLINEDMARYPYEDSTEVITITGDPVTTQAGVTSVSTAAETKQSDTDHGTSSIQSADTSSGASTGSETAPETSGDTTSGATYAPEKTETPISTEGTASNVPVTVSSAAPIRKTDSKSSASLIILITAAVIVSAVLAVVIIRKKKARKK